MEDKKNARWPGWEVSRLIGRGSYGAVYEIRRELYGNEEKAALKHIRIPQNSSDIKELYNDGYDEESITATFESHLKNIISEYSLMRKLNGSANVVNCDDVRVEEDRNEIGWDIYIKMELLTPMTDQLPKQIPEETVIKLGRDLCSALVLCRKHSIVHRDIKPQNIFVSDDGDYKLGDFGIAKTVEKTMGGTKTGTYKYMAPEVYNNQPYGHQADIYSLGLVLYWLLNKKRMPFMPLPPQKLTAGMDEQARSRRLSGEPLPPPADGSEALKRIVLKACAYDPKNRYHTAEEMLANLNAVEGKHHVPVEHSASGGQNEQPDARSTASAWTGEEADTVGAFGSQPAPASSACASVPEEDEGTVGVFGATAQISFAPSQSISSAAVYEEDCTVGAFGRPTPQRPTQKSSEPSAAAKKAAESEQEKVSPAVNSAQGATSALPNEAKKRTTSLLAAIVAARRRKKVAESEQEKGKGHTISIPVELLAAYKGDIQDVMRHLDVD
jgi:serine/threonine protein kinase